MQMKEYTTTQNLSLATRSFHWLIAIIFLFLWALGFFMATNERYDLYSIHKQAGVILASLMVFRTIYRLWVGWLPAASHYKSWEQRAAKVSHWLLLIAVLLVPASGMLYSGASGHGFGVFGWWMVPSNYTGENHQVIAYSETWADFGLQAHALLTKLFIGLVALHIAAALKHHFIDKDSTLTRMLGHKQKRRPSLSNPPSNTI